jgi:hypothetical protein
MFSTQKNWLRRDITASLISKQLLSEGVEREAREGGDIDN